MRKLLKKSIIIPIVFLLIGVGSVIAYNQTTQWLKIQRANSFNSGVVTVTNQYYEQAKTGELRIRPFLLEENGILIIENGKVKQGEVIILILKVNN